MFSGRWFEIALAGGVRGRARPSCPAPATRHPQTALETLGPVTQMTATPTDGAYAATDEHVRTSASWRGP